MYSEMKTMTTYYNWVQYFLEFLVLKYAMETTYWDYNL
jgi:hypothetical protein